MKNYLKIILLIGLFVSPINIALAIDPPPVDPVWGGGSGGFTPGDGDGARIGEKPPLPTGPGWENNGDRLPEQGDGARGAPIDDYLPLLFITASAIMGIYYYKQKKIIQK